MRCQAKAHRADAMDIVLWLKRTYRDDQEMQVSHETIYLSLLFKVKVRYVGNSLSVCVPEGRIGVRN